MSLLLTLGLGGSGTPPTPPSGGDTPYMSLLLPTVSVTLGPLYATEVNQALTTVDSHDHSDGFGKLVGTNGLNINSNLTFHGYSATNLDSASFNIRSHTAGLVGSIYMSGQDLYCVDGAGAVIQITAAGAVNVSGLGGWTGLIAPAQASYNSVTHKFALQSNTTGPKYGMLSVGDILLYPADPDTGGIYTQIKASGSTTYTMTLPPAVPTTVGTGQLMSLNHDGTITLGPTLPAATSFLRMSSVGGLAADVTVDGSTLELNGAGPYVLRVKPLGITDVQLGTKSVTQIKQSDMATGLSAIANGTATGAGPTTIKDVAITALGSGWGRPVIVSAWPLGSAIGTCYLAPTGIGLGTLMQATFEVVNVTSGVVHAKWTVNGLDDGSGNSRFDCQMPQFIPCLTSVSTGANTFRLRVGTITAGATVTWVNLYVYATQL